MQVSSLRRFVATFGVLITSLTLAAPVHAGKPGIDNGQELSLDKPYQTAQSISDVFVNHGLYGKLQGTTPIDIYTFTPSKDGEQNFTLLVQPQENSVDAQPLLILLDPTTATTASTLGLPTPSADYHTAIITSLTDQQHSYNEPALLTQYTVVADQTIKLQKDKKYYLVVIDPSRKIVHYAVKMGSGKAWGVGDIFTSFGSWVRIKSDTYSGTSPFHFSVLTLGLLLFWIGMIAMIGFWAVHQTLSMLASRSKSAGYLLIKLQSFVPYTVWGALWFVALGGYIYFNKVGWLGLPFVLTVLFIPTVLSLLYETIYLKREIVQLEVTKREATIPQPLRRKMMINFVVSLLSIGSFLTIFAMYFSAK
jgi:hypothetical protein